MFIADSHDNGTYISLDQLKLLAQAISRSRADLRTGPATDARGPGPDEAGLLRVAWDTLMLKQTLSYAYRGVPYYRDVWRSGGVSPDDFASVTNLTSFPVLEKGQITADRDAFINPASRPDEMRCTSGTTARRLLLYGNAGERAAIGTMIQARLDALRPGRSMIVLRVVSAARRFFSETPGEPRSSGTSTVGQVRFSFNQDLAWFNSVDNFVQALFEVYFVNGDRAEVEFLHVTPPFLFAHISRELTQKGVDVARSKVRDVLLTGGFVFERDRQIARDQWGARLHSSFSCTEINGECRECPQRPGINHVGFSLHAEVVDANTLDPVGDGEHGLLLLTSYYPFQQVMPMIRYVTGDVVEKLAGPCACGDPGPSFRVVGRRPHCLDVSDLAGRRAFIGTRQVSEVLSSVPPVPSVPFPRLKLTAERGRDRDVVFDLVVESNHTATFDVAETAANVRRGLESQCDVIASAVRDGRATFRVHFVQKGELGDFWKLYPDR